MTLVRLSISTIRRGGRSRNGGGLVTTFFAGEIPSAEKMSAIDLNNKVGGSVGGVVRTGTTTDATTSETVIDFRTFDAVSGRRYIPKLSSNLLSAGGTSPAGFTVRFRWAAGNSVTTSGTLIQTVNDFISTGSFQHYRFYETSLDYAGIDQQITVGIFALAIAPMTLLRFVDADISQRHFRVVDDGVF
jgi:hypothetical protein